MQIVPTGVAAQIRAAVEPQALHFFRLGAARSLLATSPGADPQPVANHPGGKHQYAAAPPRTCAVHLWNESGSRQVSIVAVSRARTTASDCPGKLWEAAHNCWPPRNLAILATKPSANDPSAEEVSTRCPSRDPTTPRREWLTTPTGTGRFARALHVPSPADRRRCPRQTGIFAAAATRPPATASGKHADNASAIAGHRSTSGQ